MHENLLLKFKSEWLHRWLDLDVGFSLQLCTCKDTERFMAFHFISQEALVTTETLKCCISSGIAWKYGGVYVGLCVQHSGSCIYSKRLSVQTSKEPNVKCIMGSHFYSQQYSRWKITFASPFSNVWWSRAFKSTTLQHIVNVPGLSTWLSL